MIPSHLYLASFPTGSSYICSPPVLDTDIDTMYLVTNLDKTHDELIKDGWNRSSDKEYPPDLWESFRKDKYNALITDNLKYFNKFLAATEEAKRLNLIDKKDRIELFEKFLGKSPKDRLQKQHADEVAIDNMIVEIRRAQIERNNATLN